MPACGSGVVSPVGWRNVTLQGQPNHSITVLVQGWNGGRETSRWVMRRAFENSLMGIVLVPHSSCRLLSKGSSLPQTQFAHL